ncbi:MAG: AAA family ATPase [Pseudomonadales bacterium]|nr:AAA family ATPase [Pseudomonadales bacterium]
MYGEMMKFYGLEKDFDKAQFFESDGFIQTLENIKAAIRSGGIVALTGIVGTGKTTALRKIEEAIAKKVMGYEDQDIVIVKVLATDKHSVNTSTIYTALFADLPKRKDFKISTGPEKRERCLQEIISRIKKPILLLIDDAHDLKPAALVGLKRIVETVQGAGGIITILVVGHPKLSVDLHKPTMEEVGARAKVFEMPVLGEQKKKYIEWVLEDCLTSDTEVSSIVTEEAINLLRDKLMTPLQITYYLMRTFAEGANVGDKPISRETVEKVLSPELNGLEARLARNGFGINTLCRHLGARRTEIRAYFAGQLIGSKADEFEEAIHKLGVI